MDKLPILVLNQIFDYLSIDEIFKLKCLSRNLKIEIEKIQFDTLFIYNGVYPFDKKWKFTNNLINYNNSFRIRSLDFLESELIRKYFKNIKKLFIRWNYELNECEDERIKNEFFIEKNINYFKNLEQIELEIYFNSDFVIELNQLKILTIITDGELNLKTPNLEVLICSDSNLNKINMENTKLKFLQSNELPTNLIDLKHLEQLISKHIHYIDTDFLVHLTKLIEINFYSEYWDLLDETISDLNERKKQLKLNNLKIIGSGFQNAQMQSSLFNDDTFSINKLNVNDLNKNYDKLVYNILFNFNVDYNCLINCFESNLPDNFFQKFTNITSINVKNPIDLDLFFQFLSNCGYVDELKLIGNGFSNQFFNRLSHYHSLNNLYIEESNNVLDNYDLITNLKYLQKIQFENSSLSIEFLNRSFNKCKYLKYFNYYKNELIIELNLNNNQFELMIFNKTYNCKTIDQVIRLFRKNKIID